MKYTSMIQRAGKWLAIATIFSFGFVMAQSEPSMSQVYSTAQSGKLDQAQVMIQQVLISHPKSAKAHFVQSELYARQGNLTRAREALANAEKLAPGLPFAKPETVQTLRSQLAAKNAPSNTLPTTPQSHYATPAAPSPSAATSSFSWGLPLLLTFGVIVAGYFMFRRRTPEPFAQQPGYPNQGSISGPQSFGMATGPGGGLIQPPYGQPPYGQTAGNGLGGRIMGGVATGLAVGAGVMAAEAIGRNLMENHNPPTGSVDNFSNNDYQPIDRNVDMGGQNFGVNDSNSWDDSSSSDVGGGGGDWDN